MIASDRSTSWSTVQQPPAASGRRRRSDGPATRERLRAVDWNRSTRGSTVNLLANPHGFALCGEAYVVILEATRNGRCRPNRREVRLRIAESMGHIENPDWMKIFELARFADVAEVPQIGRGIEIDT